MSQREEMNWDDLRIFLAVSRRGSLSAAAKALHVTQPTVGRRLKGLEEVLGARLFERRPEGYVPTTAGSELLPLAEAMERTALTLDRKKAALAEGVRGTVRISAWETLAQLLTDQVSELRARLPEIEIEIAVNHIYANLSRREADLLIQECLPENPSLIARKLASYSYAVYGARDYVARHPEARSEARYGACTWVGYDEEHTYFHNQTWLLDKLEGGLPAVRTNNGLVLHDAVRQGAGLGVLPCFSGDRDLALVRLTPPLEELTRRLHLVVHQDLRRVPAVRAVMDLLAEVFARETPRFLGLDPIAA
ncbi:MAG: LysR family transcriptional regulator [Pseudomonadota bacterium]